MNKFYTAYARDEFETPVCIAENLRELGEKLGYKSKTYYRKNEKNGKVSTYENVQNILYQILSAKRPTVYMHTKRGKIPIHIWEFLDNGIITKSKCLTSEDKEVYIYLND